MGRSPIHSPSLRWDPLLLPQPLPLRLLPFHNTPSTHLPVAGVSVEVVVPPLLRVEVVAVISWPQVRESKPERLSPSRCRQTKKPSASTSACSGSRSFTLRRVSTTLKRAPKVGTNPLCCDKLGSCAGIVPASHRGTGPGGPCTSPPASAGFTKVRKRGFLSRCIRSLVLNQSIHASHTRTQFSLAHLCRQPPRTRPSTTSPMHAVASRTQPGPASYTSRRRRPLC